MQDSDANRNGMRVREGRWITSVDITRLRNVCVLGAHIADGLFPLEDPIGGTIRVDSERYSLVGVLEELGRASGSVGPPLALTLRRSR